jgi:hypothetical protein
MTRSRLRLAAASLLLVSCATPAAPPPDPAPRIRAAEQGLEADPRVQAHRAAVEAAKAKQERSQLVDGLEVRVGDAFEEDEHQVRALARVKVRSPLEVEAERGALRAETEIEIARLEEASLERRVAQCFPSVEALVYGERAAIYARFAERQRRLLEWNEDWRRSGVIDELSGARFEIDSRTKLATRRPSPIVERARTELQLPAVGIAPTPLDRSLERVRSAVREHHPSVAVHRATADRYRSLAERASARRLPKLRFVDVFYEHQTERSRDGVGGQVAFEIPFGGESRADVGRYRALARQQRLEADAFVGEQLALSRQALEDLHDFESRAEHWIELEGLAERAEEVADRWWRARLARPSQVAGLLDDAFAARIAVLEARERAAAARCALLAMTGVPHEAWPRR